MAFLALSSLGLLVINSIPTVIGVAEAIDAQKKQNQQAKERIKFHLTANFSVDGKSPAQQATVVFKDNKVWRPTECTTVTTTRAGKLIQPTVISRPPRTPGTGLQVQRVLFRLPERGETSGSCLHGIG